MFKIMSVKILLGIAFIGVITACQTPKSKDAVFSAVTAERINAVMGKRLELDDNFIVLDASGSVSGMWGDGPVVGTWEIKDGFWCRTYSEFYLAEFVGAEECHIWNIKSSTIEAARDRGKGNSYRLNIVE